MLKSELNTHSNYIYLNKVIFLYIYKNWINIKGGECKTAIIQLVKEWKAQERYGSIGNRETDKGHGILLGSFIGWPGCS